MSSHVALYPFELDGVIHAVSADIEFQLEFIKTFMREARTTIESTIAELYPTNKHQCLKLARLIDSRVTLDSLEEFVDVHIRSNERNG